MNTEIQIPGYFEALQEYEAPFINLLDLEIMSEFDQHLKVRDRLKTESDLTCYLSKTFSPEQFMRLSKCSTIDGLDDFDRYMLRYSYLFEGDFMSVEIVELDMVLDFRIVDGKTVVYSLSDHFYDETEEIWLSDGFARYVDDRKTLLWAMHECRNKFINALSI